MHDASTWAWMGKYDDYSLSSSNKTIQEQDPTSARLQFELEENQAGSEALGILGEPICSKGEVGTEIKRIRVWIHWTLLKLSPVHEQVPVLAHDWKPISESIVIREFTDVSVETVVLWIGSDGLEIIYLDLEMVCLSHLFIPCVSLEGGRTSAKRLVWHKDLKKKKKICVIIFFFF